MSTVDRIVFHCLSEFGNDTIYCKFGAGLQKNKSTEILQIDEQKVKEKMRVTESEIALFEFSATRKYICSYTVAKNSNFCMNQQKKELLEKNW